MRQIVSSGSVKAIFLNRDEVIKKLCEISSEASIMFPEIEEIKLFGSLVKGDETGLSDVDIFILIKNGQGDPIERMRPYFSFF